MEVVFQNWKRAAKSWTAKSLDLGLGNDFAELGAGVVSNSLETLRIGFDGVREDS
jgi:hypothetical protein